MENATKALIIIGAVLIAVILISVGIKMLNSTQGATTMVETTSTNLEASVFNEQFLKYVGTPQSAAEIKSLLLLAASTWKDGSQHNVKVTTKKLTGNGFTTTGTKSTATSIANLVSNLKNDYIYSVTLESETASYKNGYICLITIK